MKAIIALDKKTSLWSILCIFLLTGCQSLGLLEPTATPNPPTATTVPPTELTICLGVEPESLYPYAATSQAAQDVLQAIYDGPIDMRGGEAVPVILERIPSISDGSVSIASVEVSAGNEVIDTRGYPITLRAGVEVFPAGCTRRACTLVWDGSAPLMMDQMAADYTLLEGMRWSDGQPLRAADSVFSFRLASDPATPLNKLYVDQTESYSALDVRTVHWVGKPGLLTDAMERYFWMPLPEHAWGEYTASELLETPEANRAPLGWGAYVLEEWAAGESIRLKKNPNYFRAAEGLPYFDFIQFLFMEGGEIDQITNGQCDILSDTVMDIEDWDTLQTKLEALGLDVVTQPSPNLEMLAMGIKPASYDDGYYPYGSDRADILGDIRTRQAIAFCIDRDTITQKLLRGMVQPAGAYLDRSDPLAASAPISEYPFNPTSGMALLKEAGWVDYDLNSETPLTALSVANVPPGTPLEISLHFSTAELQGEIAAEIINSLRNCGFKVNPVPLAEQELYLPAEEGMLFGRKFDLALVPWDTDARFHCEFFETNEIPTAKNNWLGEVTGGANFFGYSSPAYDAACREMNRAGLDLQTRDTATCQALGILSADLPFIPLFHFPQISAVLRTICRAAADQTVENLIMDIESIREGEICGANHGE